MHSNVHENTIQGLIAQARADGVQKLCIGAVIKDGEKFLLIERVRSDFLGGLVEVPGGGVEPGESLLQALARETREETGLVVTSVESYVESFDYTSASGKKARQFNFLVSVAPSEVKLNPEEHAAYYWVSLKDGEFSKLNITAEVRAVLKKAI